MRAITWLLPTVLIGMVLVQSCDGSSPLARNTNHKTLSDNPSSATVSVRADPGSPTPCQQLPFPGPLQYQYQVHDCWSVSLADGGYEFFLGGVDPNDSNQGILFAVRWHVNRQTIFRTPRPTGNVTIFFANWGLACFRTPLAGLGAFDADHAAFLSTTTATHLCPPVTR